MSRGNGTLGDDTPRFSLLGGVFGSDGWVVPRFGIWKNIPQRHGLVDSGSLSGSCIEGRDFSLKGMCSRGGTGSWLLAPLFVYTVKNADTKYVDTDALGGCATLTVNVIIRPMGPMVSLALPRSSWPTKRRTGIFSRLYWSARVVVRNSWLK